MSCDWLWLLLGGACLVLLLVLLTFPLLWVPCMLLLLGTGSWDLGRAVRFSQLGVAGAWLLEGHLSLAGV